MYLVKTPCFIQHLFPNFTWRIPTEEKVLYLTFDDGPIPEVTPWVMAELAKYDARATFFCVGDNVRKHGEVFDQLIEAGHSVGNHTFNHLNGWNTDVLDYFNNVRRATHWVKSPLFRPPYGKLRRRQALLLHRYFRIVMWDVLSGDFDVSLSGEDCWQNVLRAAGPGSIIVMHDSLKAEPRLRHLLPRLLAHYAAEGYSFRPLSMQSQAARRTALPHAAAV